MLGTFFMRGMAGFFYKNRLYIALIFVHYFDLLKKNIIILYLSA